MPVYIRHFYDDKVPVDGYLGVSMHPDSSLDRLYGERTFSTSAPTAIENIGEQTNYRSLALGGNTLASEVLEIPLRTNLNGFLTVEVRLEGFEKLLTSSSIQVMYLVVSDKLAALEEFSSFRTSTRMRVFGAAGITENV